MSACEGKELIPIIIIIHPLIYHILYQILGIAQTAILYGKHVLKNAIIIIICVVLFQLSCTYRTSMDAIMIPFGFRRLLFFLEKLHKLLLLLSHVKQFFIIFIELEHITILIEHYLMLDFIYVLLLYLLQ